MAKVSTLHTNGAYITELTLAKEIEGVTWTKGTAVVARTFKRTFTAEIIGFKNNCAVVFDSKEREFYAVSFRNLVDPLTNKPLRKTEKKEHISISGVTLTGYLPQEEEFIQWRLDEMNSIALVK